MRRRLAFHLVRAAVDTFAIALVAVALIAVGCGAWLSLAAAFFAVWAIRVICAVTVGSSAEPHLSEPARRNLVRLSGLKGE